MSRMDIEALPRARVALANAIVAAKQQFEESTGTVLTHIQINTTQVTGDGENPHAIRSVISELSVSTKCVVDGEIVSMYI